MLYIIYVIYVINVNRIIRCIFVKNAANPLVFEIEIMTAKSVD